MTLVSDETSVNSAHRDAVELRLTAELQALKQQRDELEREVLRSRDHVAGQVGELRNQLVAAKVDDANHRSHIERLESALAEATRTARQVEALRRELSAMKKSATWKVGRALLAPVHLVKRIVRRG